MAVAAKRSPVMHSPHRRRRAKANATPLWHGLRVPLFALLSVLPLVAIVTFEYQGLGLVDYHKFQPSLEQLPSQLALRLKVQRANLAGDCRGYGVTDDIYFPRYHGERCGLATWQSSHNQEAPGQFLRQLELVTKAFTSEDDAHEYYWRFWGRHMYQPIPYHLLMDMTLGSPAVGTDTHVFMWDPALMNANPGGMPDAPHEANTKHIVYVFRQGRFLVKLTGSGFVGSPAMELTPHFVSQVAAIVADRITQHDVTPLGSIYRQLRTPVAAHLQTLAQVFTSRLGTVTASSLHAWNQTQSWAAQSLASSNSSPTPFGNTMGSNMPSPEAQPAPTVVYTILDDDNSSLDLDLDEDYLDSNDVEGDTEQERITWRQSMQASSSMARSWVASWPTGEQEQGIILLTFLALLLDGEPSTPPKSTTTRSNHRQILLLAQTAT